MVGDSVNEACKSEVIDREIEELINNRSLQDKMIELNKKRAGEILSRKNTCGKQKKYAKLDKLFISACI